MGAMLPKKIEIIRRALPILIAGLFLLPVSTMAGIEDLKLGMKSMYAEPGDTVWMPVYLVNHEDILVSRCSFDLSFCGSPGITFLGFSQEHSSFLDWVDQSDSGDGSGFARQYVFDGTQNVAGYGDGEIVRFQFAVSPGESVDAVCSLGISAIRIKTDDGNLVYPAEFARTIDVVAEKPPAVGDVDGNGTVTGEDAQLLLLRATGATTDTNLAGTLDISGNGVVTGYDASLILAHSVGLIARLVPQEDDYAPGFSRGDEWGSYRRLFIDLPVQVASTVYRYDIYGYEIQGLVSATVELDIRAPVHGIKAVESGVRGSVVSGHHDSDRDRYTAAVVTSDPVENGRVQLFSVFVSHDPLGGVPGVFSFENASVNEFSDIHTSAYDVPTRVFRSRPGPKLRAGESAIRVFDLQGRVVSQKRVQSEVSIIPERHAVRALAPGVYVREKTPKHSDNLK